MKFFSEEAMSVRCPYCGLDEDRVVDSRPAEDGEAIRRRRECQPCGQRFSTYERVEQLSVSVRKRNGLVEPFAREKVHTGMLKATKNREIASDELRRAVAKVEARVRAMGRRLVPSEVVGAEVLAALKELDHVGYMRFASVYKGFTSPEDFRRELAHLEKDAPPKRPLDPSADVTVVLTAEDPLESLER
jgi:transcriptional repressor NrdR